ncbi:MAG: CHAP domain-containing protein [Eubacteriales bacterium]|nr:CHAP domain-containing protein [Eubacteriales bacterium]
MSVKKKILFILCCMILLALPLQVQAAGKISISGASKPATLKQGAFFNMKGTITSSNPLKEVRCTIYNSTDTKCLQRYVATPGTTSYSLQSADAFLAFDKLKVGTYYYKVLCIDNTGYQKRVINKKFKVGGTGKIRIVNPVPSADITITGGAAYSVGGKVTSTYKIKKINAKIIDSNNKAVYSKNVKPNSKSYELRNSPIDMAMSFDRLSAGSYKYKLTVTDSEGTSAVVVYRNVSVAAGNVNVSANATGASAASATDTTYLNTTEPVVVPAGFTARTTRPAANNAYYYNKKNNIYYKYNSLAPTGKVFNGVHYVKGNCTWYACGRALEIVATAGGDINKVKAIFGYDPVGIFNMNIQKGSFSYGSTPKIGALAVFSYGVTGDAHIAVVENIIGGVPYVSESGYGVTTSKPSAENITFAYQSIYKWAEGRRLLGYIYLI